jgi:hypothetical protein
MRITCDCSQLLLVWASALLFDMSGLTKLRATSSAFH